MNAKQFFELTAKMREARQTYFRTPSAAYRQKDTYLQESKRLEESTFGSGREHP